MACDKKVTIEGKDYALVPLAQPKPSKDVVLLRCYGAGVHVGHLVSRNGKEVTLSGATRIWKWTGANTLHELSQRGAAAGSKISEIVPEITLIDVIEIIPCSEAAAESLLTPVWK